MCIRHLLGVVLYQTKSVYCLLYRLPVGEQVPLQHVKLISRFFLVMSLPRYLHEYHLWHSQMTYASIWHTYIYVYNCLYGLHAYHQRTPVQYNGYSVANDIRCSTTRTIAVLRCSTGLGMDEESMLSCSFSSEKAIPCVHHCVNPKLIATHIRRWGVSVLLDCNTIVRLCDHKFCSHHDLFLTVGAVCDPHRISCWHGSRLPSTSYSMPDGEEMWIHISKLSVYWRKRWHWE
jgi:hypothetical protein